MHMKLGSMIIHNDCSLMLVADLCYRKLSIQFCSIEDSTISSEAFLQTADSSPTLNFSFLRAMRDSLLNLSVRYLGLSLEK